MRLCLPVLLVAAVSYGLLLQVHVASAPTCVCDTQDCEDVQQGDCPGLGVVVYDPCRCCRVCARTEGEPCGGELGFSGECEPGLTCTYQPNSVALDLDINEGICQRDD